MSAAVEIGLFLDGLRCAGCVNRTERALRAAEGVCDASVNYTNHRAWVRFDPERTTPERLAETVAALGFRATPYDPTSLERPSSQEARVALVRLLVAGFLAMNVMWIAIALYAGDYQGMDERTRHWLRWVAIALSLPSVAWCALPFWRGALAGLARRELTIDVPIALGVAVSFAVSIAGTLTGSPGLYMDSAAVIVFLILLGRTLERGARARASAAVDRLAALSPATALRLGPAGPEQVPADALRPGDRVRVPAGEVIPADGKLLRGTSESDESPFTGESHPVLRRPGDAVTGGTRNLLAEIEVEVSAAVDAGTLARLVGLLERAQAERPQVQRLADRVASVFAPAVLAVAAATAIYWTAAGAAPLDVALTTAAVLIVACPCALGLATPAAVTAAIGRAAQLGILVKSGTCFERCARVDALLLDKTGTLSEGRLRLEAAECAEGVPRAVLLAAAALAEGSATHPIAAAVRSAAAEVGVADAPADERETRPGLGVVARTPEGVVRVGTRALLEEAGCAPSEALCQRAKELAGRGLSLAWVARDERVLGLLGFFDAPRPDAAAAVRRLTGAGLEVALVTGDHADAAAHAAVRSGIRDVQAAASPEQKLARVRGLRRAGRRVLFAGDGINDAAALAAADVGVAMATGSDVTLHAADVVIRAPRLAALPDLLALSRRCVARIRENLGFAVVYNALAVPLAASGRLDPLVAAVAMGLSSLVVTANAVRLLRWRPQP